MKVISIAIPVYNDDDVLTELYSRLNPILQAISQNYEIIFIDDGSCDRSVDILQELQFADHRIRIIRLANNFGQANAIAAGLDQCLGEYIVIMDSDLSDRPEDIPALLKVLNNNKVDMVIAQRLERYDGVVNRFFSKVFFSLSNLLTNIKHPPDLGVFRILKRSSYQKICNLSELNGTILSRFYQAGISYETLNLPKDPRFAGTSGYTMRKKMQLAFDRLLPHMKYRTVRQSRNPYFVIKEIIDIRETK
ncbi:MAG: glycosyltransferase family 2 protein [Candidatus Delongbacteria bacterium]|nr:glycosyltransferase family 2 protein [Candidatus Delongbacteria bacterium]